MKASSNIMPEKFVFEANGAIVYSYHIEEKQVERLMPSEDGEDVATTETQYDFEMVRTYLPISSNKLLQAVITDAYPADYEQKLVNEYNSAVMGLYDKETAEKKTAAYKAFLEARAALKAIVEADCEEAGIR